MLISLYDVGFVGVSLCLRTDNLHMFPEYREDNSS